MAPYYLTALIHLMGPVRRVAGATRITFPERIATSEALYGRRLPVSCRENFCSSGYRWRLPVSENDEFRQAG